MKKYENFLRKLFCRINGSYKNWGTLLQVVRNAVEVNGETLEKLGHLDRSTNQLREAS